MTSTLSNKIDFAVVIGVNNANPNGDPLNGNRPRTNPGGDGEIGEMSDVCIKRKIRDRLMEMKDDNGYKYNVFVQPDDRKLDDYPSLSKRATGVLGDDVVRDAAKLRKKACETWIDVRSFGQVFAYDGKSKSKKKGEGEKAGKSVSVGIRGPVTVHEAYSLRPVNVISTQITKSVSGEGDNGDKRGSDTMGMKHRVGHGLYVCYGSMNPQLAQSTGFSNDDAQAIKEALTRLFENDASSARPEGSMEVVKLIWWMHNCPNGQYSSAKVHRTLKITTDNDEPRSHLDYNITVDPLEGLHVDVIDGW